MRRAALLASDAQVCARIRTSAPATLIPNEVGGRPKAFDDLTQIRLAQGECERVHEPGQRTWGITLGVLRWACECANLPRRMTL
jgi:hypothetical protein